MIFIVFRTSVKHKLLYKCQLLLLLLLLLLLVRETVLCLKTLLCVTKLCLVSEKIFCNGKMIGIFCFLSGSLLCFRHNIELCFAPVGHRIFPEDKTTTTKIITLLSSFCCRFPSLLYQEVLVPPWRNLPPTLLVHQTWWMCMLGPPYLCIELCHFRPGSRESICRGPLGTRHCLSWDASALPKKERSNGSLCKVWCHQPLLSYHP